jgi:hypothetical protein
LRDAWVRPIDRLSRTRLRPELARAYLLYGEWLRREDRRVDAPEQLRTAHDMLAAIGMEAFAERGRRELVAAGETVRKRSIQAVTTLTASAAACGRLGHGSVRLCPEPKNSAAILPCPATRTSACSRCRARDVTGSCQSSVDTCPVKREPQPATPWHTSSAPPGALRPQRQDVPARPPAGSGFLSKRRGHYPSAFRHAGNLP